MLDLRQQGEIDVARLTNEQEIARKRANFEYESSLKLADQQLELERKKIELQRERDKAEAERRNLALDLTLNERQKMRSEEEADLTLAELALEKMSGLRRRNKELDLRIERIDLEERKRIDREDELAALRKLVLQIRFDGQAKAAVCCPLGDFFGTAPGWNAYRSLLTGLTDDGGYALWYMPFAKSARVELINQDTVPRELEYDITHAPLAQPFEGLGHFHCQWHRDTVQLPEDRWPDWPLLNTQGRGRFCGVMLHVWNPRGGWWGEGDEKFFVDGEKFPSTFGTGSEDYFGYAWCHPGLFQRAYHAQTMTQANKGHQSVLRWHLVDNVPFQTGFEGCIEKYYRTEERGTQYASVACWYLAPDGVDPYAPVPAAVPPGRQAGRFLPSIRSACHRNRCPRACRARLRRPVDQHQR